MPRHTVADRFVGQRGRTGPSAAQRFLAQRRPGRASTADLAQRLNPLATSRGPLAPITGNPFVVRSPVPFQTGAEDLFQTEVGPRQPDPSGLVSQFLDPTLTREQTGAAQALQRGAAGGGLIGGAVQGAVQRQQRSFLAGNRLEALGGLQREVGSRLERLSGAVAPLFALTGGGGRLLGDIQGGPLSRFRRQEDLTRGFSIEDAARGALTGLQTLGRGDIVRSALFGQLGNLGQGLSGSQLPATEENALLLAATSQFLDPRRNLAQQAQRLFGRAGSPAGFAGIERSLNQLRAGSVLAGFFQQQLGGLSGRLQELQTFGLGLAGQGAATRDPEAILGADVSQFQNLFGAVGLAPQRTAGLTPFGGTPTAGENREAFLERVGQFRARLSPTVRASRQPLGRLRL